MFSTSKINDPEYFLGADERGPTAYYVDDDGSGIDGETRRWFVPLPHDAVVAGVLAFARDGEDVGDGHAFRELCAGRHPATGAALTQRRNVGGRKPALGQNCCFSAPKSVSLLFATATPAEREQIREAMDASARKALAWMSAEGIVRTRRGSGAKGMTTEAAAHWSAALFHHTTARPTDDGLGAPQLHVHACIPATVVRQDGTTGALSNEGILVHQGVIGAVFRAELAAQLTDRLGVGCVREKRWFEIAGAPEAAAHVFSGRRAQILAALDGRDTADDRAAAQRAAILSRRRKVRTTAEELEAAWTETLRVIGHDAGTIRAAVMAGTAELGARRRDGFGDEMTDDEIRKLAVTAAAAAAVRACFASDAVVERRKLLLSVEALQGLCGADDALASVEAAVAADCVVIAHDDDGRPLFSTPECIARDRTILSALNRRGETSWVPADVVEAAVADAPHVLSDQQAACVRWACGAGSGGVCLISGVAGAGKTTAAAAVVSAYEKTGHTVHALAPSWSAATTLGQDTGVELSRAVQGWLRKVERGDIRLDSKSVILCDEAGLLNQADCAALIEACGRAGARLILQGDSEQLHGVGGGGGSPFALLERNLGSSRLDEVRRQGESWMREATGAFATRHGDEGIRAYIDRGRVAFLDDDEAAMSALVSDWKAHVAADEKDDKGSEHTRLVVAGRNRDIRILNAMLRQAWRESGRLAGDDVVVQAIGRGEDAAGDLALAVGDAVQFSERVEGVGTIVNNGDIGTVLSIGKADDGDHAITFSFTDGRVAEGRLSQFVGKRPQDSKTARVPKWSYGHCVSAHVSQGRTVSDCYVYAGMGEGRLMGAAQQYVAMSRHRRDARMYVPTDALRVREPDAGLTDEQADAHDRAEWKRLLCEAAMRNDQPKNPADYAADIEEFVRTGDLAATRSPGELLRARMERKAESAAPPPAKAAIRTAEQSKAEVEHFKRDIHLADFIAAEGWKSKRGAGDSWTLTRGAGKSLETVAVKKMPSGIWSWTSKNGSAHGSVIDWLARSGLDFASACQKLRDLGHGRDDAVPWSPPARQVPPPDAAFDFDSLSSEEQRPVIAAGAAWASAAHGWTDRLRTIRRLSERCLMAAYEHIRHVGGVDMFCHRDSTGRPTGFEKKGGRGADGKTFGGFSTGGRRLLFRAGETTNPRRIVVAESAIDALSWHDAHDCPTDVLILSLGGNATAAGLAEIRDLARRHPSAEWLLATDNDGMGAKYRDTLKAEIAAANPAAVISDSMPPDGRKDWSDFLQQREENPMPSPAPAVVAQPGPASIIVDRSWLDSLPASPVPSTPLRHDGEWLASLVVEAEAADVARHAEEEARRHREDEAAAAVAAEAAAQSGTAETWMP